jgi:gliding motility-associated lipoprotein GldD
LEGFAMNFKTPVMKSKLIFSLIFLLLLCLCLYSCGGGNVPKPHGYFRFDFPDKEYRLFDSAGCPFVFEYPVYSDIKPDNSGADKNHWFNLICPQYQATIYLSYVPLKDNFVAMLEDVHSFLYKHAVKADAIESQFYANSERHTAGFLFDIGGNAASSLQFYVSDSVRHFLRGSLYFYATPNRDSLAPLIDFFREDMMHLMETVEFR